MLPERRHYTQAEQQWYAIMAESVDTNKPPTKHDEVFDLAEKKIIASPHRATTFRIPGAIADASEAPRISAYGRGRPVAAPLPRGREVNSRSEVKPVPGKALPLAMVPRKPGFRPPPPMHPSTLMRKLNGMPPSSYHQMRPILRGGGIGKGGQGFAPPPWRYWRGSEQPVPHRPFLEISRQLMLRHLETIIKSR